VRISVENENDVEILKRAAPPLADFECPRPEQTEYFVKHAWENQQQSVSVTYVLLSKGTLVGYVTLTMDEIPLAKPERPEGIVFSRLPALKLAQMGVHKDFNGNGFGHELVTYAILAALELKERVGCRYVTLDAKGELVEWYRKQGFVLNEKDNEDKLAQLKATPMSTAKLERRIEELTVSMRLDLHCLV
jgi:GNAT superfamily N-acetyltransferase